MVPISIEDCVNLFCTLETVDQSIGILDLLQDLFFTFCYDFSYNVLNSDWLKFGSQQEVLGKENVRNFTVSILQLGFKHITFFRYSLGSSPSSCLKFITSFQISPAFFHLSSHTLPQFNQTLYLP